MQVIRPSVSSAVYALDLMPRLHLDGVQQVQAGLCHLAQGTRSPAEGLRSSAAHELAYVVRGHVRVDTASGSYEAHAGDMLSTGPAELHATTALADSTLYFVLLDPV